MSSTMKVLYGVIIVLIVGAGAYYFINKPHAATPAPQTKTPVTQQPTQAKVGTVQGTLKELLSSDQSQACTYTYKKDTTDVNGKIFVSNGKMRGDFVAGKTGESVNTHMLITDKENAYFWTDLSKRGMKISLTGNLASNSATSQTPDLNQKVDYSCQGWTADASKFTLPADISFYSITLPSAGSGSPAEGVNPANACSACNSLPASAQVACKTQLHCQ